MLFVKENDMNILVTDDSKMIRYMIIEVLNELGYADISEAANVAEAKTLMKSTEFTLIISDLHMPGESGLDFLKFIRTTPAFAKLPFILLTTDNEKKNIVEAVQSGVHAYLFKPVQKPALEQKLAELSKKFNFQAPLGSSMLAPAKPVTTGGEFSAKDLPNFTTGSAHQKYGISFNAVTGATTSIPIHIGTDMVTHFSPAVIGRFSQQHMVIICDSHSLATHQKSIDQWKKELNCSCIPLGDECANKTLSGYESLVQSLVDQQLDTASVIIAVGERAVINTAAFVAATYLGGIRLVIVPTSLAAFLDSTVGAVWTLTNGSASGIPVAGVRRDPAMVWYDASSLLALVEKEYVFACANFFRYLFFGGPEQWETFKKLWETVLKKEPEAVVEMARLCVTVRAAVTAGKTDELTKEALLRFAQPLAETFQKESPKADPGQELFRAIVCMFEISRHTGTVSDQAAPMFAEALGKIPPLQQPVGIDSDDVYDAAFGAGWPNTGALPVALPSAVGCVVVKKEIPEAVIRETLNTFLSKPKPAPAVASK